MRAWRSVLELLAPVVLVVVAGLVGAVVSQTNQIYFIIGAYLRLDRSRHLRLRR